MNKFNNYVVGIIMVLVLDTQLYAVDDTFSIKLGGLILAEQSTEISYGIDAVSTVINLEDIFGMETESQVLRLDGYYRFSDVHRMEFSYYRLNSSGSKTTTNDFLLWDGRSLSAGANVSSYFDYDIYKVNYTYSVYHSDKVEFGLGAGLHITAIDLGLNAQGTIDGVNLSSYNESTSVAAPLPVLGFRFRYDITSDLATNFNYDFFALKVGDYKGNIQNTTISLDYAITKNFGIGAGFDMYSLVFEAEKDNKTLKVNRTVNGGMLFLSYQY